MAADDARLRVSAAGLVNADPARVYSIIADYRNGHPRIVPEQFSHMEVERGGFGDGTIITFQVRVLGRTTKFRAVVTEPEPGRVLVERNVEGSDSMTTFEVAPGPDGRGTTVTITTDLKTRDGILGWLERAISKRVMEPMYRRELEKLAEVAAGTPSLVVGRRL